MHAVGSTARSRSTGVGCLRHLPSGDVDSGARKASSAMQDARNVRLRLTPPASAQNGWHTALVRTAGALGAAMTTTYSTRCVAADLARRVLNAVLAVPAGRSEGMSTRRLHFALPYLRCGAHTYGLSRLSRPSLDAAHMTISRPAAVADLRGSVPSTRQQRKPKRGDKSQAVPKRRREAFASDRTTSCATFGDASTTAPVFLRQQLNLTALRGKPHMGSATRRIGSWKRC